MNPVISFLGILNKGGYLLIGQAIKDNLSKVKLLIIAKDCSSSNANQLTSKALSRKIEVIRLSNKKELGSLLGLQSVAIIGITNQKAALALREKIGKEKEHVQEE